jgi:hypothetical protein
MSSGHQPDDQALLLHYDYERDKDGYPEAHIQVEATSEAWDELLTSVGRGKIGVGRLHLPVGGRRFRPALEDLIEAFISDEILEGAPGWREFLNESRDDFRRLQLRAAIRREPDIAVAALLAKGYQVAEPGQATNVVSLTGRQRRGMFRKR